MVANEKKPKPKSNPLRDYVRFLTFRATREEMRGWTMHHFLLGLFFTWLVGIARNWDLPTASIPASLGVFSIIYIFFMATLLFVSGKIFSDYIPSYGQVLTMVALTSAPGLVYGIPVEMFMTPEKAIEVNIYFLVFVATYRVALAVRYFVVFGKNSTLTGFNVLLSPVSAIILALPFTGRTQSLIDLMGGLRGRVATRNDGAHGIILLLCVVAFVQLSISLFGLLIKLLPHNGFLKVIFRQNDPSEDCLTTPDAPKDL